MLSSPGSKAFELGDQRNRMYMASDFEAGYFTCYCHPALRELKSKSTVCPFQEVQHLGDQLDRQICPVLRIIAGPVCTQAIVKSSTQQVTALHLDQVLKAFALCLRERSVSAQDDPTDVHNMHCRADHSRPAKTHRCIVAPKRSSNLDRRYRFQSFPHTHINKLMHLQTSELMQYKRNVQHCAICVCRPVQAGNLAVRSHPGVHTCVCKQFQNLETWSGGALKSAGLRKLLYQLLKHLCKSACVLVLDEMSRAVDGG